MRSNEFLSGLRRLKRLAAAPLALAVCLFASASFAASVPLRLEELVAISDAVVTVRVTKTESKTADTKIYTEATVQVLDSMKGKLQGEQKLSYLGGKHGSLVMEVPGVPKLRANEEAILFLSQPWKRMSAAEQKKFNAASPLVTGYYIVGSWQGKLDILNPDGTLNVDTGTRKGAEPLPSDVIVTRKGRVATVTAQKGAGSYSALRSAITGLAQKSDAKRATKAPADTIKGVNGGFYVPEVSKDPVVRSFDPLPSIAYMKPEEFEKLQAEWKAEQQKLEAEKAQKASPAAPAQPANP